MAISVRTGATASLSTAGTSLSFASSSQQPTDTFVITVSILTTTVTVSSVGDGTNVGTFQAGGNNGTNVRTELWTMPVASLASRVITITFSGSTLASAAYTAYDGATAIGNISAVSIGTNQYPSSTLAIHDEGSYVVSSLAVATLSGDTFTAYFGTLRQSVIPALTTSSIALVDNTSNVTTSSLPTSIYVSTARAWAAVSLELRTGLGAGTVSTSLNSLGPDIKSAQNYQPLKVSSISGSTPVPVAKILQSGTVGVPYSETISSQGGASPYTFAVSVGTLPTNTSLNTSTGVISGTPTVAGTFSFTIKTTDANGSTGTQAFEIIVSTLQPSPLVWVG